MTPVKIFTARPFPLGREERCKAVIAGLIKADTIQEFHGHSYWCNPAFFVRKGADDVHMVVDLPKLNVATNRFGYPFESTESVFQKMEHSARVLVTLDLLSAYFQLRVAPEDWHLLTFLLPTGKYQFKRLPMGWIESQDHLN